MDVERIEGLARHIERLRTVGPGHQAKEEPGYFQGRWKHRCDTPACIAGWAIHLFGEDQVPFGMAPMGWAATLLGLTHRQQDALFQCRPALYPGGGSPSARDAAATLRHLARTGEVEWRRA